MNKKQRQAEQILQHGLKLQRIFPATNDRGPAALCKQLHRLETFAHRKAEDYCNGLIETNQWENVEQGIKKRLNSILGDHQVKTIINADPRGYALKIDDQYIRDNNIDLYRDWGGYGILCPEFTGDN